MVHFFSDALLTTALCPNRIPRKAMNYMQAAGFLAAVKCAVRCARRSVVVVVQPACAVLLYFCRDSAFSNVRDIIFLRNKQKRV